MTGYASCDGESIAGGLTGASEVDLWTMQLQGFHGINLYHGSLSC
jgi:hypothetical protein